MGETRPDEAAEAEQAARRVGGLPVRFRAGETIFRPGDSARGWIVVESGRVRVGLTADTGREVVLYRLGAGDSCLLTTSALLSQETMLAEAVAETDVAARLVPVAAFERLLAEDAAFRRAVLRNYAERVGELVVVIQDVLFHALPERLARHPHRPRPRRRGRGHPSGDRRRTRQRARSGDAGAQPLRARRAHPRRARAHRHRSTPTASPEAGAPQG